MKSIKEMVYSTDCDLYAVTETNLKRKHTKHKKTYM